MNSYGGKTDINAKYSDMLFESSVNSYGGKTVLDIKDNPSEFESSVNSYGGKTYSCRQKPIHRLRVV